MTIEMLGAAGMANELKQTYDRRLLSVAEQNLVALQYGEKKDIPAGGGKSIEFRKFEKVVVGTHLLTEGTPPTETQLTVSNVAVTISQYGAFTKVSDLLQLQSFDPVIAEFTDKYAIHAAEVLDTICFDILVAGTTVQYASTAGSRAQIGSGMYLNSAELAEARRTLRRGNAKPIEGNKYICFIHPDNTKDLYDDSDIVNAFKDAMPRSTENPLFSGEIGDWLGVKFVETTNLHIFADSGLSTADVYGVLMVAREAYGVSRLTTQQLKMIVHPLGSGGHTDPLEQYSTVGWKAAMAAKILNQDWMVRIECASSYNTMG